MNDTSRSSLVDEAASQIKLAITMIANQFPEHSSLVIENFVKNKFLLAGNSPSVFFIPEHVLSEYIQKNG